MRILPFFLFIMIAACNSDQQKPVDQNKADTISAKPADTIANTPSSPAKLYSNERFKEVMVERVSEQVFRIRGKAQVFEASFGWVIEDGHDELQSGHQMTDAGAPEWGAFNFVVDAPKKRPNTTLHLVLFELSAKDGSRQHVLPVVLW